jgi:hypothetical protein
MSKHTPKPWKRDGDAVFVDVGSKPTNGYRRIANVCTDGFGEVDPECVANGDLIAAAPELLAACKLAIAALSQNATFPADLRLIRMTCAEAIAKATGGVA